MAYKPLPAPVIEFPFTADTFNLYIENTQDGDRVALEQAEQARREEMRKQALDNHPTLQLV